MSASLRMSVFAAMLLAVAGPALAGSIEVAPNQTAQIDVGSRDSYTSITVTNRGAEAGRLEIAGTAVAVPANGQVELYDRYGRNTRGPSYVTVTNSGTSPLRLLSRYQLNNPTPSP